MTRDRVRGVVVLCEPENRERRITELSRAIEVNRPYLCSGRRVACEDEGIAADTAASTEHPKKRKKVLPCLRELIQGA